jgi:hypothetical protein
MSTRAEIEAILPRAGEAVLKATGLYATGFGITSKFGALALGVILPRMPDRQPPESILGVPVVFTIAEAPMFLGRRKKAATAHATEG